MSKQPGYVFAIEGGGKAIALHHEQNEQFKALRKYYCHFMNDDYTPVLGEDGLPKKGLKAAEKLKLIGYTD